MCGGHVFGDHVWEGHVCEDHVCESNVCESHVCESNVCESHVCGTHLRKGGNAREEHTKVREWRSRSGWGVQWRSLYSLPYTLVSIVHAPWQSHSNSFDVHTTRETSVHTTRETSVHN